MQRYATLIQHAVVRHWVLWLAISFGFFALYYVGLLLATMLRFGEIPNYVVFHEVFRTYRLIVDSTPSLTDMIPILIDEPWFETGYKNPHYYGIATWSYMLIPPKMLVVFFTGGLVATMTVLAVTERRIACPALPVRAYATAGVGTALVGLTSATLTWVVCCAAPTWVVGLAMLGMSSSLALLLEPLGLVLMPLGLLLIMGTVVNQMHHLAANADPKLATKIRGRSRDVEHDARTEKELTVEAIK